MQLLSDSDLPDRIIIQDDYNRGLIDSTADSKESGHSFGYDSDYPSGNVSENDANGTAY